MMKTIIGSNKSGGNPCPLLGEDYMVTLCGDPRQKIDGIGSVINYGGMFRRGIHVV
jgi:hypothetical protein